MYLGGSPPDLAKHEAVAEREVTKLFSTCDFSQTSHVPDSSYVHENNMGIQHQELVSMEYDIWGMFIHPVMGIEPQ